MLAADDGKTSETASAKDWMQSTEFGITNAACSILLKRTGFQDGESLFFILKILEISGISRNQWEQEQKSYQAALKSNI